MAIRSEAQKRCVERYLEKNYASLCIRWPKDFAEEVRAQAQAQGQSIAGYVRQAVEMRMLEDGLRGSRGENHNTDEKTKEKAER